MRNLVHQTRRATTVCVHRPKSRPKFGLRPKLRPNFGLEFGLRPNCRHEVKFGLNFGLRPNFSLRL